MSNSPEVSKVKDPVLFCRADSDLVAEVQEIADREYEGVISRVVRAAVRKFVEANKANAEVAA